MNRYRVLVCGENFLLEFDGRQQKVGFYTTRFLESATAHDAQESAFESVGERLPQVLNSESDPPRLLIEEIEELDSFEGLPVEGTGLTFFPEESDS